MEITETKLITLRASEDKILTNGEIYRKIVTFSSSVDSPNNWNEVPIEEYNENVAETENADIPIEE